MTEKLTWDKFVEKYEPETGDKFLDEQGNKWEFRKGDFVCFDIVIMCGSEAFNTMICPLIPPKKKRKMWPAIIRLKSGGLLAVGGILHESLESAQRFEDDQFHSWPAIPGPDGSYEIDE